MPTQALGLYFLDENGNVDRSIPPILDGTMQHVDEVFKMLCEYISMTPLDSETEVLFVSDGADCLILRQSAFRQVFSPYPSGEKQNGYLPSK